MLSSLNPSSQRFLNEVNRVAERMERAQRQIATGVRVDSAADDPDQTPAILQVRASLASAEQIQSNLGRVKAETDTAEQTLQSAVRTFDRVRVLAAQAASGTQTDATRQVIAGEVRALLEQLVGATNSAVEGRYLFSGDLDQQAPYSLDWTQIPPVSAYQGGPVSRLVEHPNGTTFTVARSAAEIFDSPVPAENVFQVVNNLRVALEANDDPGIRAAIGDMSTAGDHLNTQLAYYGSVQSRVGEALAFGERLELDLRGQLSGLQDTDMTAAILELNQARTHQDAALSSWARMPRTSLFDYLG